MLAIDLTSKVALITGGARGIGKGITEAFAEAGAFVAINYASSGEAAEKLAGEICQRGGRAVAFRADVSDFDQVKSMVHDIIQEFGKIDILVNNAGITSVHSIEDLEPGEWDRILKVNLYGVFNNSKVAAEHMVIMGEGVIINISSTGAFTGGGGGPHYSASKAALHGFTRALARELAPKGIRVNSIAPTVIESDFLLGRYPNPKDREKLAKQIPVGRIGNPLDVGYMAAFMASPLGSFISGEIIIMDGGRTFR